MAPTDLIPTYLQLRGGLAAAYSAPQSPGQQEHIERLSRQLAGIENALEASELDDDLFCALLMGRLS